MRRGMLSFVIGIFAVIILLYFESVALSLLDYQVAGQKQLEAQILSQRYENALAFYNQTVLDAISDAAYNSTHAGACNPLASGSFGDALKASLEGYINASSLKLTSLSEGVTDFAYGWPGGGIHLSATEDPAPGTLTPPCGVSELQMSHAKVEVAFRLNATSTVSRTGYFLRTFNQTYHVYLNGTAGADSNFTVMVRDGSDSNNWRCIKVVCSG